MSVAAFWGPKKAFCL